MPRYLVALDEADGQLEQFNGESIDPEKIRERFRQTTPPEVLHEVNDEGHIERAVVVGNDEDKVTPKARAIYVWFVHKKPWEDPEILQNALFCSEAVYERNPFMHLKEGDCKTFHTVMHAIALGDYKSGDSSSQGQRCLMVLTENPESKEKMLVVAFRGSENKEDWLTNLELSQKDDNRFLGMFHGGFLQRANTINLDDIFFCAGYYEATKIITCGHSLGGAVSTIVHMMLLDRVTTQFEKKNIISRRT